MSYFSCFKIIPTTFLFWDYKKKRYLDHKFVFNAQKLASYTCLEINLIS